MPQTRSTHVSAFVRSLLIAAAGCWFVSDASAELLAYEGFDYPPAKDGLSGQAGGSGWGSGGWSAGGLAKGIRNAGVAEAGALVFSDYPVLGNVAQLQNNHHAGDEYQNWYATRPMPTLKLPEGSSVYFSFLYRQEQAPSFAHRAEVGVGSSEGESTKFQQVILSPFGKDGPDQVELGYDGTLTRSEGAPVPAQDPVLVITRFDNINGTGGQFASMYVLTEADYDRLKAGGITQEELDTLGPAVTAAAARVTLGQGDYLTLDVSTAFGIMNNSYFDEIRVFTDLADLTAFPGSAPVASPPVEQALPEPMGLPALWSITLAPLALWARRSSLSSNPA